jgi:hypothetical protein
MINNSEKQKREAARWLQSLIGEDWGIRAGFLTMKTAERRRTEELVEAIVSPSGWDLAA